MSMIPKTPPLPIGTIIKPWGKIAAIRSEGGPLGERFYFFVGKDGGVALIDAYTVERRGREGAQ